MTSEGEMTIAIEVSRYRVGMAELLEELVSVVGETERWLDVAVDGDPESLRNVLEEDSLGAYRIPCALFLHKSRLHMRAMLRANNRNNIHSLAVQMRPILECAGQVVHVFRNLMIAPKNVGKKAVLEYVNSDFYQAIIGLTKGDIGHTQLLTTISDASTMSGTNVRESRRMLQTDKVAALQGGKAWYRHLSNYFCHGNKTDWSGTSWQGGVGPIDLFTAFTLAGFMDYLVKQVAVMNLHAALCPVDGDVEGGRIELAGVHLQKVRDTSKSVRDSAVAAIMNAEKGVQDQ